MRKRRAPGRPLSPLRGEFLTTPTNHNPRFAPVIHPTLETGVEAMTTAALDALSRQTG